MNVSHVNSLSMPSFKGKIIDAHTHIGELGKNVFQLADVDKFVKNPLSNGDTIDKAIISTLSPLGKENIINELDGNKELLKAINGNDKFIPLISCNPKTGSVENIKKLFNEYKGKFAGLKFHPDAGEYFATDDIVKPYMQFAQEKKLPCVFHTAISYKPKSPEFVDEALRYSSPDKIYNLAKQYKDVPVVMAHLGSGGEKVHQKALSVLKDSITNNDATLYADISWVDCNNPAKPTIINTIKMLKDHEKGDMTSRIFFGSDAPLGEFTKGASQGNIKYTGEQFYEHAVIDTKNAIKKAFPEEGDGLIDKIFYQNAKNLFCKKADNADTKMKFITENLPQNKDEAIKTIAARLSGAETASVAALPPAQNASKNPGVQTTMQATSEISGTINNVKPLTRTAASGCDGGGNNNGFLQKICAFVKQNKTACVAFAGAVAIAGITTALVVSNKKKKSQGINNASSNIKATVNIPLQKDNIPKVFAEFSTFA